MKLIKKNIKIISRATCKHEFERFAFFHTSRVEIQLCKKCNKRKEIQH